MFRLALFIAAILYRCASRLHHRLCLRPGKPLENSRLVVIGSFRTGGAGKTPFCIWLCNHLAAQGKNVALLCHEYAFDEIAMLQEKFSTNALVEVFATRNRYRAAHELDKASKFDIILCDDGFEDSRLVDTTTIILEWEDTPSKISDLWPLGKMRSLAKDHQKNLRHYMTLHCNGESPDIRFVIDKVSSPDGEVLAKGQKATLLCGIGAPERFMCDVQDYGIQVKRLDAFKDHCRNFAKKLETALQQDTDSTFIITEKDAARLPKGFFQRNKRVHVASQKAVVSPSILKKLEEIGL